MNLTVELLDSIAITSAIVGGTLVVAWIVIRGIFDYASLSIFKKGYHIGLKNGARQTNETLYHCSYWFSEHVPTQNLIEALSKHNNDTWSIREQWKKDMEAEHIRQAGQISAQEIGD